MSPFAPGTRLHDRYELRELIGAGGMAEVWRADDLVLGRAVAVKALDGRLADDPQLRAGARREAQAAAKLTHPNITAIHDYAEVALDDGRVIPYLVMELLTGQTLEERLRQGPLEWKQAAVVIGQVAAALSAAHAQGVVHQDVKPANVMLTATGVKVLDFGIAAVSGSASPDWIVGTPAYAPPERLAKVAPAPAGDVFSLGVVAFEMLTGRLPWPIETWAQAATVDRRPASLPHREILAALEIDPARRPTAIDLGLAIGELRNEATALVPVVQTARASARVPQRPTRMYEPAPPPAPQRRRSPYLAAAFTLVLLLLGLSGVFFFASLLNPTEGGTALPPAVSPTPKVAPSTAVPVVNSDVDDLLTTLRQAIDLGILTGQIDDESGQDIKDRVQDLADRYKRQRVKDFVNKAEDLRKDIKKSAEDGEISQGTAIALDIVLQQLIEQAKRA